MLKNKRHFTKKTMLLSQIIFLLLYLASLSAAILIPVNNIQYTLSVHYSEDVPITAQLFYDIGSGMNEKDSQVDRTAQHTVSFSITPDISRKISSLRFDPATFAGEISIKEFTLSYKDIVFTKYAPQEIINSVDNSYHISSISAEEGNLIIHSENNDPGLSFSHSLIDSFHKKTSDFIRIYRAFGITAIFFLMEILILFIKIRITAISKKISKLHEAKALTRQVIVKSILYSRTLLLISYLLIAGIFQYLPFHDTSYQFLVYFEKDDSNSAQAQLFYDIGSGFQESDSQSEHLVNDIASYEITKDIDSQIRALRLDPVSSIHKTSIKKIEIKKGAYTIITYPGNTLKEYVLNVNHIDNLSYDENCMSFMAMNSDPQIFISEKLLSPVSQKLLFILRIKRFFFVSLVFAAVACIYRFFILRLLFDDEFCARIINHIQNNTLNKLPLFRKILYVLSVIILTTAVILFTVTRFLLDNFNGLSLEEIIFHLKVPMAGTSDSMIKNYFSESAPFWAVYAIFLVLLLLLLMKKKGFRNYKYTNTLTVLFSFLMLISSIVTISYYLDVPVYIKSQLATSTFIEENYHNPKTVKLTYPEKKRNLIYIYLESMESTFISKEEGGAMNENIIPELTKLAADNINFSETDLVGGAASSSGSTWTIGAMVAQTSGLPLLIPIDGNSYGDYAEFLPGCTSLGDLLKDAGYTQEIMVGSDLSFGGRELYFSQHGNYKTFDYYTAIEKQKISPDYKVWWGFEDQKLFSYAKEEITELASQGKPFNFTMLTVDTHHTDGYICPLCQKEHDASYENVLSCASRQVGQFVQWIQKQDFYENTTVIICGDHPTMDNFYIKFYYDESSPRRVYNCFINAVGDSSHTKNRTFNTFDLFPTTLSAMGIQIEGERLGLGTNLFSGEKTLAEEYGLDAINAAFSKNSKFYKTEILKE